MVALKDKIWAAIRKQNGKDWKQSDSSSIGASPFKSVLEQLCMTFQFILGLGLVNSVPGPPWLLVLFFLLFDTEEQKLVSFPSILLPSPIRTPHLITREEEQELDLLS